MSDDLGGFLERVKDRAGHSDLAAIEQAVRATLRTLGGHLGGVPPALHDALPRALRPELAAGTGFEPLRPAALYQQVAELSGLRVGAALEVVQSTMAELSERLPEPARETLRTSLPPAWAALVPNPNERPRSKAKRTEVSGMYKLTEGSGPHKLTEGSGPHKLTEGSGAHTLSSGRPGSSRPLADARPPAGQADSIATSDDPHGDRLATAHGPGPQDEESTLAKGRPGSRHPVSDSDD